MLKLLSVLGILFIGFQSFSAQTSSEKILAYKNATLAKVVAVHLNAIEKKRGAKYSQAYLQNLRARDWTKSAISQSLAKAFPGAANRKSLQEWMNGVDAKQLSQVHVATGTSKVTLSYRGKQVEIVPLSIVLGTFQIGSTVFEARKSKNLKEEMTKLAKVLKENMSSEKVSRNLMLSSLLPEAKASEADSPNSTSNDPLDPNSPNSPSGIKAAIAEAERAWESYLSSEYRALLTEAAVVVDPENNPLCYEENEEVDDEDLNLTQENSPDPICKSITLDNPAISATFAITSEGFKDFTKPDDSSCKTMIRDTFFVNCSFEYLKKLDGQFTRMCENASSLFKACFDVNGVTITRKGSAIPEDTRPNTGHGATDTD